MDFIKNSTQMCGAKRMDKTGRVFLRNTALFFLALKFNLTPTPNSKKKQHNALKMKQVIFLFAVAILAVQCGKKTDTSTSPGQHADSTATPLRIREVMGIAVIEPGERITKIASEQAGVVRRIAVNVGQKLRAGQTILLLDAALENAQLGQANSKIATQNEAVQAARENLLLLQVKLKKARADFERDQSLFKGNALTQKELDNSRYQVADLEQQLRAQEAVIRQQQTRLGELQADIAYFQTLSSKKNVRAPADGTLLSLDAKVGQFLDNKGSVGDFAPAGPVIALTEIDELFADKIQLGQKAVIRPQGRTEVLATGTVVLTSPYLRKKSLFSDKADDLEDRRVREVRVQIDQPEKVLFGARVECVISVE